MTLKEYVEFMQNKGEEVNYATIARDIPCAHSTIEKIANGKRRPSYEMARRIEQATNSMVTRYNWYKAD